jgi:hypothetical protein
MNDERTWLYWFKSYVMPGPMTPAGESSTAASFRTAVHLVTG